MEINVYELVLELTRWCNMQCNHCIRGARQRHRMSLEVMQKTLRAFDRIDTITFSGGEPFLAVDLMRAALDECRWHSMNVGNVFIATNGSVINGKVKEIIKDWLQYTSDGELNCIRISTDQFHDPINKWPWEELKDELIEYMGLKVYFEYLKPSDTRAVIDDGFAKSNGIGNRPIRSDIEIGTWGKDNENVNLHGALYVNVYGDMFSTCGISYRSQAEGKFFMGNVLKESAQDIFDRFVKNNRSE
jgi:hypothetical protein